MQLGEKNMKKPNYDTYCGLYCGACDMLRSYENGRESIFSYLWTKPTLKAFLKLQEAEYGGDNDLELKCQGCKSDEIFIVCRICKIRECAINKNVEHCSDCGEYPCKIYSEWNKNQVFMPHIKDVRDNLENIKEVGTNQWILDQEKRWKCQKCGKSFSWYSTSCDSCGADLREYAFKFSKLKLLVMRTAIRLSSFKNK
jgi:hypothetical protein